MRFARLTDRSRGCVEAAFDEARMLGHDSLGDEDLLLGILRADEGLAAEVLASLGVTLEGARDESEGMLSDALSSIGVSFEDIRREAGDAFDMSIPKDRKIPYSPRAKDALVRARKEMRKLGDDYLGTEHVLLGMLYNEDGTAVRMLGRMGVSPEALEERVFELRDREAG
jgi:ATP-dependent Clp protease ATP-binding subunit ClpC